MVYSAVSFGGVNLNVTNCIANKRQKTYKQVMGKSLSEVKIIGMSSLQNELSISGIVFGTTDANLDTNRAAIENLDVASSFAYVDGLHDGYYYVKPGTLKFSDKGDEIVGKVYRYTMSLVEE